MKNIVLASSSFRRQEMLKWLGIPFEIEVSNFAEESVKREDFDEPEDYVATIAMGKALTVKEKFPDALVIASDTMVYLDGVFYGKPKDLDHARKMMQALRGNTHTVYTAVVMLDGESGESRTEIVESNVRFGNFADEQLEKYIATSEPYDKAGGYALQGFAQTFVEDVQGSATNVIGFPLMVVRDMLEELGVPIDVNVEESVFQKTGYRT
ncbi:MAG TPA: nucleoside triphosphate pyrophosphatase [Candidatus Saccharimonadia bacterium]|nr:nucleoside triphosphate pyrophosphatase [Candidatus Saccharimonadia bacterium]